MATITFTLPDAILPRVVAGMCGRFNYQEVIDDPVNPGKMIPNPETKSVFCKRKIREFIKQQVLEYESQLAATAAHETGNSEVVIT